MLFDLGFAAVGIFMIVRRRSLARLHLQMQKKTFRMRGTDDQRMLQATENALLFVGMIVASWCLTGVVGVLSR